ncbi:MAG: hypothetical protein ACFBSD_13960, partial [Paracoccaceae bacterium]
MSWKRRARPAVAAVAMLMGTCLFGPVASAQSFESTMQELADEIAEALSIRSVGRQQLAEVYVRPPFDDVYRVVCAPLSRRIGREFRTRLPQSFAAKLMSQAFVVQRPGKGEGQYTVNLSWRDLGGERVELSVELGDLSDQDRVTTVHGNSGEFLRSELRPSEQECLAELDIINRVEVAEETLFIHRSANITSDEIGIIDKGDSFRLLGQMPYTDGNWAVVKMLDDAVRDDPFSETVGFTSITPTANDPKVLAAELAKAQDRLAQMTGDLDRLAGIEDRAGQLQLKLDAEIAARREAARLLGEEQDRVAALRGHLQERDGALAAAEARVAEAEERA